MCKIYKRYLILFPAKTFRSQRSAKVTYVQMLGWNCRKCDTSVVGKGRKESNFGHPSICHQGFTHSTLCHRHYFEENLVCTIVYIFVWVFAGKCFLTSKPWFGGSYYFPRVSWWRFAAIFNERWFWSILLLAGERLMLICSFSLSLHRSTKADSNYTPCWKDLALRKNSRQQHISLKDWLQSIAKKT